MWVGGDRTWRSNGPKEWFGALRRATRPEALGLGTLKSTLAKRDRALRRHALITVRAANKVRATDFADCTGELDAEAVAIATGLSSALTAHLTRPHSATAHREALRDLIEADKRAGHQTAAVNPVGIGFRPDFGPEAQARPGAAPKPKRKPG